MLRTEQGGIRFEFCIMHDFPCMRKRQIYSRATFHLKDITSLYRLIC